MKQLTYFGLISCLALAACGHDAAKKDNDAGKDGGQTTPHVDAGKDSGVATKDGGAADSGTKKDAATDDDASSGDDAGATSDASTSTAFAGNVTIVYSAEALGVDTRTKIVSSVSSDGTLQSYVARLANGTLSTTETPTRGTCKASDLFRDSIVAVGRLDDGTLGGDFYGNTPSFGVKEGFHYAIGSMDTSTPTTGSIAFPTQVAATAPTIKGGGANPGTVTGTAKVDFANAKVAVDLSVMVGADTYTLTSAGGIADPSTSELTFDPTRGTFGSTLAIDYVGTACTTGGHGTCTAFVQGAVLGDGEDRLAITFAITGSGNGGDGIHGVLVLKQ